MTKIILLTGVTRGLGKALAEEFIRLGHTVVGCGRNAEGVLDLRFAHPAPHRFDVIDVAEASRVEVWAETILSVVGVPDLVINNAAIINEGAPLWKVPGDAFSRLVDINIKGVASVIRGFVPAMVERGTGVIVNLSSGWGRSVSADFASYCASKWAIEGLTKALAEELPAGMAAVPLSPGVIDTAMLRTCWADGADSCAKPEAWAGIAAPYLLKLGPKDNGQSLTVPGFAG